MLDRSGVTSAPAHRYTFGETGRLRTYTEAIGCGPGITPGRRRSTERRHAKVAELAALDPAHAKLLGLSSVGYRTLIRWENARRRFGLVGCADDRWLRRSGGTRTASQEVREASSRSARRRSGWRRCRCGRRTA